MKESYQPRVEGSEPQPNQEKVPELKRTLEQKMADFDRVKKIGESIMFAAAEGDKEAEKAAEEILAFAEKFRAAFSKNNEWEKYRLYHALIVSTPRPESTEYDVSDEHDESLSILREANELAERYKLKLTE
ncbi:MAG: hypothetical protein QOG91_392 [Candidatus Parcubacteria bacterium]|jgi:hypothetical protein|nr:hypothetical protein [Candidatus Parcubacteria bacterium]